jgi:hypothetical protein
MKMELKLYFGRMMIFLVSSQGKKEEMHQIYYYSIVHTYSRLQKDRISVSKANI